MEYLSGEKSEDMSVKNLFEIQEWVCYYLRAAVVCDIFGKEFTENVIFGPDYIFS